MRSYDETLRGWGSVDPDDLAAVLCAAVRAAGVEARVQMQFLRPLCAVAIEVTHPDGTVIASFPLGELTIGDDEALTLCAAIEELGKVWRR
jgi:hypothetical protein